MTIPDSALDRARAAARAIAPRSDEIEAARRLPADIAQDLAAKGLLNTLTPAAAGGLELPPAEALDIMEVIAEADAAAGWCAMIAATCGLGAAYLPAEEARAIFAEPGVVVGGVFAPAGRAVPEGGAYRVSGRWQWASGSANCHWLMGGCAVVRDGAVERLPNGAPAARIMVFPASQAALHDTWYAAGLSGTGSGEMEVAGIAVPHGRSFSFMTERPVAQGLLYVFPVFGLLALGIAAVALGNARGAMTALQNLATEKRRQGSTRTIAETANGQTRFAAAEAALRGARAYLQDAVWVDRPARLFGQLVAETIRSRSGRVVVDGDDPGVNATDRLHGSLRSFGYDARSREAVVVFDAVRNGDGSAVVSRRFEARVAVAEPEAGFVGPALNRAANQVAGEVAEWIG